MKTLMVVVFLVGSFCINSASALTINFDVSGSYVKYADAPYEERIILSGSAILDIDESPLDFVYHDLSHNFDDLFNSFGMTLSGDNGEVYSGSISFGDLLVFSNYDPLRAVPYDTYMNINNLGFYIMEAGPYFTDNELISLPFLPTWSFRGGEGSNGYSRVSLNFTETTAPVPEPATMLLLGTGMLGLAGFRKKLKK